MGDIGEDENTEQVLQRLDFLVGEPLCRLRCLSARRPMMATPSRALITTGIYKTGTLWQCDPRELANLTIVRKVASVKLTVSQLEKRASDAEFKIEKFIFAKSNERTFS